MKSCPNCGADLSTVPASRFCYSCGAPLPEAEQSAPGGNSGPPEKRKGRGGLIAAVILLAVFAAAFAVFDVLAFLEIHEERAVLREQEEQTGESGPSMKDFRDEKEALQNQISGLEEALAGRKSDADELNRQLKEKDGTIAGLQKELEALRPTEPEAPPETEAPCEAPYRIAMITDYGCVDDQTMNQELYEAGLAWCEANGVDYTWYKPTGDSTPERIAAMETAIEQGYNILLLSGWSFDGALVGLAEVYPDVKFICPDIYEFDMQSAAGCADDFSYVYPDNVCCIRYHEEIPAFMAGYAAVKLGSRHLCFLGGMAVPATVRYGSGFTAGADCAARELGIAGDVTVEYVYADQFFGDPDVTAYVENLCDRGVDTIFCGGCGGVFTSAGEAALKYDGVRLIGCDTDQAACINGMFETKDLVLTSAAKNFDFTVSWILDATVLEDGWQQLGGRHLSVGMNSEDPAFNFVGLGTTLFNESFTQQDYEKLCRDLYDGRLEVTDNDNPDYHIPTDITVNYLGNIK